MNQCASCGMKMVSKWPGPKCGPCRLSDGDWDEERYELELVTCAKLMDPRHRTIPYFTPLMGKKPLSGDEEPS